MTNTLIGIRVKELRREKNINQSQLAKELGATPRVISFLECGKAAPSYIFIQKLAKYFDVSIDYLTGLSDYKSHVDWYNSLLKHQIDGNFFEKLGVEGISCFVDKNGTTWTNENGDWYCLIKPNT